MEEPQLKGKFKTLAERESAIAALISLKATPGWKDVLALRLDDDITMLVHSLENREYLTLAEYQRDQDRLRALRNLRNFPDVLIKELQSGEQKEALQEIYA